MANYAITTTTTTDSTACQSTCTYMQHRDKNLSVKPKNEQVIMYNIPARMYNTVINPFSSMGVCVF